MRHLVRRWTTRILQSAFPICAALTLSALPTPAPAQDYSPSAREADFKKFVEDFEDSYAYLDRPDKPWLTWEARYGSQVAAASSKEAFDTVIANALSELHDFHAEVRSPVPDRWLPVPTFADIWAEWRGGDAIVQAVRSGSDASRAGIIEGDQILAVNATPIAEAVRKRLTAVADQQDAFARQWALLSILTGRSDEERVLTVRTKVQEQRTVVLPVERKFDRSGDLLTSSKLPGNIGYIRFNNSLGEQKTVAAFDSALASLQHTHGLVLDLRDVPSGGDSSVALGILGRFVTRLGPYQRHRIPNYGQKDVERNWIEFVAPRGPFTYTPPVVVLVDHWTGSMGEGMAIGFDALHRGVVVGTPMAQLAGAVTDDVLPKTGTHVAFATEQLFHVNGIPRQDWLPRVLVQSNGSSGSEDRILRKGLEVLKNTPKWPPGQLIIAPVQQP